VGNRNELEQAFRQQVYQRLEQPIGALNVYLFRTLVLKVIGLFYTLELPVQPHLVNATEARILLRQFHQEQGSHFFRGASLDPALYHNLLSRHRRRAENYFTWDELQARTERLETAAIAAEANAFLAAYSQWLMAAEVPRLDYPLQLELFQRLCLHPQVQQYFQRYTHWLIDDIDEARPIEQWAYEHLAWGHAECIYTGNPWGGLEQHLGAYPAYLNTLRERPDITLEAQTTTGPYQPLAEKVWHLFSEVPVPPEVAAVTAPLVLVQEPNLMLERMVADMAQLKHQGVAPEQMVMITWALNEQTCLQLSALLERHGLKPDLFRGSQTLQRAPLVQALVTLLQLVLWEPLRGLPRPKGFDMAQLYRFATELNAFEVAELHQRCGDQLAAWPQALAERLPTLPRLQRLQATVAQQRQQLGSVSVPALAETLWDQLIAPSPLVEQHFDYHALRTFFRALESWHTLQPADLSHWATFFRAVLDGEIAENPDQRHDLSLPHPKLMTLQHLCEIRYPSAYQFWFDLKSPLWLRSDHHSIDNRLLLSRAWPLDLPWSLDLDEQHMDAKLARTFRKGLQYATVEARFYACHYDNTIQKQRFERLIQAIGQPVPVAL
jgi:hypothetical protein